MAHYHEKHPNSQQWENTCCCIGKIMKIKETLYFLESEKKEDGFVLIAAILMLLVLSLMAAAMTTSTMFEVTMSGNAKKSQEQFYKADAGINGVLAEGEIPADSFLPASYGANKFLNCNTPQLQPPFVEFDLDGDGVDDVALYALEKSGTPPEVRVASCAIDKGTTSEIVAGIQYGTPPGAQEGIGDPLEYNSK